MTGTEATSAVFDILNGNEDWFDRAEAYAKANDEEGLHRFVSELYGEGGDVWSELLRADIGRVDYRQIIDDFNA